MQFPEEKGNLVQILNLCPQMKRFLQTKNNNTEVKTVSDENLKTEIISQKVPSKANIIGFLILDPRT